MTPDQRLTDINRRLAELRLRLRWYPPLARDVHAIQRDLLAAIPEVRKMRRSLDEIADDAREQATLAEHAARVAARVAACDAGAVLELNRIVWDFSRRGR